MKSITNYKSIHIEVSSKIKPPNKKNKLTKKLKIALKEVAKIERGELKAINARDFLDEL